MIEDLFEGIELFQDYAIYQLPEEKRQIDTLLLLIKLIKHAPGYGLDLVLACNDWPRQIVVAWQREGYKMVLKCRMAVYDLPTPLYLCADRLTFGDVRDLLHGICLEGKSLDDFPRLNNRFQDVTREVYGDDYAYYM